MYLTIVAILCLYTGLTVETNLQQIKWSLKETVLMLEELENDNRMAATSPLGKPSSCAELLLQGKTTSGIYAIYPRPWFNQEPFDVYCDMTTDGGGWTVFQRRDDVEVHENFFRGWDDYRKGFGKLTEEFWLGNDRIFLLTNQDHVTLRIDLEDFDGNKRHAVYNKFQVSSWSDDFRVTIGNFTGDAVDSTGFNGYQFVTFDRNDVHNCAKSHKGGWWYTKCHASNLNGLYLRGNHTSYADGINWYHWKGHHYSLKKTEMKVRPSYFKNCDLQ